MLSPNILTELKQYIDGHLQPAEPCLYAVPSACVQMDMEVAEETVDASYAEKRAKAESGAAGLAEYIDSNKSDETFSKRLLSLIDQKGLRDSDVYKAAGIDRRHFSKIRSNADYRPGKTSVLALCFALQLSQQQTEDLLETAGFSLSQSNTADLIVMFCIERGIYSLLEVNEALDYFGQKPIGVTA